MRRSGYERFELAAFPVRAPRLVDENLFAVDLVDPMGHEREDEQRDPSDGEEEIHRVVYDGVQEGPDGSCGVSHGSSRRQNGFPSLGKTFLREARIR